MSQTSKRGLGRGFDALISNDFDKSLLLTSDDRIEKIPRWPSWLTLLNATALFNHWLLPLLKTANIP
jgi:hypothetical protein